MTDRMPKDDEMSNGGVMNVSPRPKLLIISFSEIHRDVRILKQIRLFADKYDVTTCGFGPVPSDQVTHLEIVKGESQFIVKGRASAIRLHMYGLAYWMTYAVREALRQLKGMTFDAVLANDLMTVGVARRIVGPGKIHVDLHEYWPGLHDGNPVWVRVRQPYNEWMLRKFVVGTASVTVVSEPIRELYRRGFGFDSQVLPNASIFRNLSPSKQEPGRLRVVHAGGASPARRIEDLMKAVASVPNTYLDLYLVGEGTEYYISLQALAGDLGERVRVLPPVPSTELVPTLNKYDVGIHQLPATNTNHVVAMPNKFYEYVQARLALVIGPNEGMAQLVNKHDLGVVAEDFTVEALADAICSLTPTTVTRFKENSERVAKELSAEQYEPIWVDAISRIVGGIQEQETEETR